MSIKSFLKERKYRKQRIKYKFSDDMCWSLDYTLLDILPKMVDRLRKYKNSYPSGLKFEEVNTYSKTWIHEAIDELRDEYIKENKDSDELNVNDNFTRWQLILKRITWCLNQANEDKIKLYNKYEEEYKKQFNGSLNDIQKPDLVEEELRHKYIQEESKLQEYRDKCKTEALDLINKYFWNLWD